MSSPKRIVSHEEDEDACPNYAAPIHLARCRAGSSWEKLEYPEHCEEAERNDVDCIAGLAKVESGRWERFTTESLLKDTWNM